MTRRFRSESIDRLESLVQERSRDLRLLQELYEEVRIRSTPRAKRLATRLSALIGGPKAQKSLAPSLLGRSTQSRTGAPPPVTLNTTLSGREIISEQRTLTAKLEELKQELAVKKEAWRQDALSRDALRQELAEYVEELVPGFSINPTYDEPTNSRFELARRDEVARLRTEAYRRWPLREELESHTERVEKIARELKSLQVECVSVEEKLNVRNEFITRNALMISNDIENDIVKSMAERICAGEDEFEILQSIKLEGHIDAVGLFTRARLYSTNVLQKKS